MNQPSRDEGSENIGVIIPAAGDGTRFGEAKQFRSLGGRAVLFHSLAVFLGLEQVVEIIVVVNPDRVEEIRKEVRTFTSSEKVKVVSGGRRRQDSVAAGLRALGEKAILICIHDAARPFLSGELVMKAANACKGRDGAIVAVPVSDTIKQVDSQTGRIIATRNRTDLWSAQTPQLFYREPLEKALEFGRLNSIDATDESFLMEKLNYNICVVDGNPENIKITNPGDWALAEAILHRGRP